MVRHLTFRPNMEMTLLWAVETAVFFGLFFSFCPNSQDAAQLQTLNSAALVALTAGLVALSVGIYRIETLLKARQLLIRVAAATVLLLPVAWVAGYFTSVSHPSSLLIKLWPLKSILYWMVLAFVIRVAFSLALRWNVLGRRVVVLGSSPATTWIRNMERGIYSVQAVASSFCAERMADHFNERIWALVVDADNGLLLAPEVIEACRQRKIRVLRDDVFLEDCLHRLDLNAAQAVWPSCPVASRPLLGVATRGFDILFALTLLFATLPVILLTAIAIKLDDGGPIFYRQQRIGLHGQGFTLFKFRSMRPDAEPNLPIWAQQGDMRATRVGAFIRRVRIDELPQVLNILCGQMSVIGPRPERPHFVQQLTAAIPGYAHRTQVKPGLTGWAQVNYPYGASVEDARAKLSYDLYYVKHRSLMLNMMILFSTVRVVLFQEGSR